MIPISCIDDFCDDPDSIRNFALSLDYQPPDKNTFFPGLRTDCLSSINQDYFNSSVKKLLLHFFDDAANISWTGVSYFQKSFSYSEDKNHPMNMGWAHRDDKRSFRTLAAVMYLNKNTCLDSGTSILHPRKNFNEKFLNIPIRNKFYHNIDVDKDLYTKSILNHNNQFDVTLDIKNRYNRMIAYDGCSWHRESCLWVPEEFRLTQIFFIQFSKNIPFPKKISTKKLQYS